jgi:hypothetical protein
LRWIAVSAWRENPSTNADRGRARGGERASTAIYEGLLTRRRARAECEKQRARDRVEGETAYRALAARAHVLEAALREANKLARETREDLQSRRITAQEATATHLRIDELRALAAATRRELDALPEPVEGETVTRGIAAYHEADAEIETNEAALRRARAWNINLRTGYDSFLDDGGGSPYFAVLSVGVNVGWLFQGGGNDRAAAARKALVRGAGATRMADPALARAREILEIETGREKETGVLVADLERQLHQLKRFGGESNRQFQSTVWFEWVKMKAEHEYLAAHVASLREVLGEAGEP